MWLLWIRKEEIREKKMKIFKNLVVFGAMVVTFSGCATTVKFSSTPDAAMIRYRGEGRASFRWKTASDKTPCEEKMYYGRMSARAIWADDTVSVSKTVPLSMFRSTEEVSFDKAKDVDPVATSEYRAKKAKLLK